MFDLHTVDEWLSTVLVVSVGAMLSCSAPLFSFTIVKGLALQKAGDPL
jgi:hypothetical protein